MTLPNPKELKESLVPISAAIHSQLPDDLDRNSEIELKIKNGEMTIEVKERGNKIVQSKSVINIEKRINQMVEPEESSQETAQKAVKSTGLGESVKEVLTQ